MAQRLIREKGQSVTWRQLTDGAPADATKPWKPSASVPVNNTVNILFLPIDRVNQRLIQALRGTEVPIGSLQGLMGAVSFVPHVKDVVIRGGKEMPIVSIDPLAPNGEAILYTIEFVA